jgi:hypothetical protein
MDFVAEPNTLPFLAVRSLILLGALVVFALAFGRWRRAAAQDAARLAAALARATTQLQHLSEEQTRQSARMLARLDELQQRFDARIQAGAAAAPATRGYELALRLARAGSTAEEISEASGVTGQEARLLTRLHGPRQDASRA